MGFRTSEVMTGEHEFRAAWGPPGSHPLAFRGRWGPDSLRAWLDPRSARFLWQEFDGEIRVGGLCGWTPARGTLEMQYFTHRRVRYTLDFEVDGVVFRYVGDKVGIRPWNLLTSHTTCFGTITELATGTLVSTSVVRFLLRHTPRLLLQVRLAGS